MNSRKRQIKKNKFINKVEYYQLQNQKSTIKYLESALSKKSQLEAPQLKYLNEQVKKAKLIADANLNDIGSKYSREDKNLEPIIRSIQNILRDIEPLMKFL